MFFFGMAMTGSTRRLRVGIHYRCSRPSTGVDTYVQGQCSQIFFTTSEHGPSRRPMFMGSANWQPWTRHDDTRVRGPYPC